MPFALAAAQRWASGARGSGSASQPKGERQLAGGGRKGSAWGKEQGAVEEASCWPAPVVHPNVAWKRGKKKLKYLQKVTRT